MNTIDDIETLVNTFEKLAKAKKKKKGKWKEMPKGWDSKSRKSYYDSIGGSVTKCMEKMKGNIDDPGAFCASLKDRATKSTKWRKASEDDFDGIQVFGWDRHRASEETVVTQYVQQFLFNMIKLNGSKFAVSSPGARPDYKVAVHISDGKGRIVIYNFFNQPRDLKGKLEVNSALYDNRLTEIIKTELNKKFSTLDFNVVVASQVKHISAFGVR